MAEECFQRILLHKNLLLGSNTETDHKLLVHAQWARCLPTYVHDTIQKRKRKVNYTYLLVSLLHRIFLNDLLKSLLKMV